jgi:autotransporter-associated beta strand protein
LVGGGGGAGSTTISVIPYAIGGTTATNGSDLVTYGANGVRPLSAAAGEYATTIASGTATADNARLTTAQAITADTTINALVLATNTPFTGSTARLTVASGTVVAADFSPTIPAAMTLAFGAAEGHVFTPYTTTNPAILSVNGTLAGTGGLTKGGNGLLFLNNPANTISGVLAINEGGVVFENPAALSFTSIRVNGFGGSDPPALFLGSAGGTVTLNKPIEVIGGFVQLLTNGARLVLAGQITGAGGVFINGGDIELTNTSNSYSGQTRVFLGNLLIGSDAVLGNTSGVDFGAGGGDGLRLTGNWTTGRTINFSFSSQVDTNGFNLTVNSPVTGTAGVVNKVGAGIWELTQGGTLGQSLTTGNGNPLTTLNVNAGELRVTNTSGSATGTARVNVGTAALAAILSGTGRIAGATTVGAAATVSPGTGGNAGTLTLGSTLTLNGTFRVDAAGDRIDAAGAVTLGAASVLNLTGAAFDPATTYTLLTGSALTGTFATVTSLPVTHLLNYTPTSVVLAPVPEPGAVLLLAAGVLGAGAAARRRTSGGRNHGRPYQEGNRLGRTRSTDDRVQVLRDEATF